MLLSRKPTELIGVICQQIASRNFDGAEISLINLEIIDLTGTSFFFLKSQLALAQSDLKIALNFADRCLECFKHQTDDNYSNAIYLRSYILVRLRRLDDAVAACEPLLAQKFNAAYKLLALIAVDRLDYNRVVEICTAGIKAYPTDSDLWASLAKAQQILQDYVGADASVKSLLTLNPLDVNALEMACEVKFALQEFSKCIFFADRLLKIQTTNTRVLARKFLASIEIGIWEVLPGILEKLEGLDPESFDICKEVYDRYDAERSAKSTTFSHQNLLDSALLSYHQGDLEKTLVLLRSADKLRPNHPLTQIQIATCLSNLGQIEEAIELYGQIETETLDNYERHAFYSSWGVVLLALNRYHIAAEKIELAMEIHPDRLEDLHNLSICYGNLGDFSRAIEYSGKALTLRPTDVEVAICHCNFLIVDEQMDLAIKIAQTTLDINPLNPKSHYLTASVLGANQQFLQAFPFACHYLKAYPDCALGNSLYRSIISKIEADLGVDRAN